MSILSQKVDSYLKLAFLLFLSLSFSMNVRAELKQFSSQSLSTIESQYKGEPFLLVVWSVDCLPCRQELAMLSDLKIEYSNLNFITIATENYQDINLRKQLEDILLVHQIEGENNWVFNSGNLAKLKYALDPGWYGELPRAYFYSSKHSRFSVSGSLSKEKVVQWWQNVTKSRKQ